MNRDIIAFTKYKFNVYGKKDIRSGRDSAVVGIVGKSKSLDFPTMLIFWSLVRNSVVLAVYLLFSVACFLTVHEHLVRVENGLFNLYAPLILFVGESKNQRNNSGSRIGTPRPDKITI